MQFCQSESKSLQTQNNGGVPSENTENWCDKLGKSRVQGRTDTDQAAGRLRKGSSGFGFRVVNREACVLLSVCEAQTRYS